MARQVQVTGKFGWASLFLALSPLVSWAEEPTPRSLLNGCAPEKKGPKTLLTWSECKTDAKKDTEEKGTEKGNDQEEKKNGTSDEPEKEDRIVTDRPDVTESSATVGRGRIQVEMGYTYTSDKEGNVHLRGHSFPEVLLRVGAFADWCELRLGWNYGVERLNEDGLQTRFSGSDDLYVGVKLALVEQKECLPEVALVLQATLPTGAEAFSANRILPGFNLLYGWDITDFLSCSGSTSLNAARDGLSHSYTELLQAFTVGYSLSDRLGAYTEWFALIPHGHLDPATATQQYFNGGFTFLVNNDVQLDVRAGVGLNRAADDFFLGSGLAFRF